jgi:hypothetical protein
MANVRDGCLLGTPPAAPATPATPPLAAPSLPPTPTETLLPGYVEAARSGSPQDYGGAYTADMDVTSSPSPTADPPLKASPSQGPPPRLAHPSAAALSASRPATSALDRRPQQPYLSRAPPELALSWLCNSFAEIRRAFEIAGGNRTVPEELRPVAERILRETRVSSSILLRDNITLSKETDPRTPVAAAPRRSPAGRDRPRPRAARCLDPPSQPLVFHKTGGTQHRHRHIS